jgi:hypothetical protein
LKNKIYIKKKKKEELERVIPGRKLKREEQCWWGNK